MFALSKYMGNVPGRTLTKIPREWNDFKCNLWKILDLWIVIESYGIYSKLSHQIPSDNYRWWMCTANAMIFQISPIKDPIQLPWNPMIHHDIPLFVQHHQELYPQTYTEHHRTMGNNHVKWINQRTKWPCSIANCKRLSDGISHKIP